MQQSKFDLMTAKCQVLAKVDRGLGEGVLEKLSAFDIGRCQRVKPSMHY